MIIAIILIYVVGALIHAGIGLCMEYHPTFNYIAVGALLWPFWMVKALIMWIIELYYTFLYKWNNG